MQFLKVASDSPGAPSSSQPVKKVLTVPGSNDYNRVTNKVKWRLHLQR